MAEDIDWSDLPPLFDNLQSGPSRERQKTPRSVGRAACGHCSAESIGLVRSPDAQHLVWRMHNLVTFHGTRIPCSFTGQHLCEAPPRDLPGVTTPTCPHERGR